MQPAGRPILVRDCVRKLPHMRPLCRRPRFKRNLESLEKVTAKDSILEVNALVGVLSNRWPRKLLRWLLDRLVRRRLRLARSCHTLRLSMEGDTDVVGNLTHENPRLPMPYDMISFVKLSVSKFGGKKLTGTHEEWLNS